MINEKAILDALRPNMGEICDNKAYQYWVDYELELDEIQYRMIDKEEIVEYLNIRMVTARAGSAEKDAVVDVASNLEETLTIYRGEFKYV